jgi:ribosomal protein S18 acetylase RimI-like enzyme
MPAVVRSAEKNDISALVDLMSEFNAESNYSLDRAWATRSFTQLLKDSARGGAWICFSDAVPAGYVVLTTRHSMEFGGLDGFIDDLFVRPKFRRTGVGTSLLERLFDESRRRGVLAVHVAVDPNNAAGQGLYNRFGLSSNGLQLLTVRIEGDNARGFDGKS